MSAARSAKPRLSFVDQTRALAIMAMILMHFGPGLLERLPTLGPSAELILVAGRFATPAFITVFGVTVGLVYGHRFADGSDAKAKTKLLARARDVIIAALLLAIPRYTLLADDGSLAFDSAAYATYSVLNYYVLGLATMPFWLRLIGPDPVRRAPVVGIGLWVVHLLLGGLWPYDPARGVLEYARLHLVSGGYPYFAMTGVALCALPVGVWLRESRSLPGGPGAMLRLRIVPLGLAVAVAGLLWGSWLGELSLQAILDAVPKAPARPWYYLLFGGLTLLLLGVMAGLGEGLRRAFSPRALVLLYPLSLMGQASLEIYTGHAYVLPGLYWLDQVAHVRGLGRIIAALLPFAVFCGFALLRRHRKVQRASTPSYA